jgi:hypothetical protein
MTPKKMVRFPSFSAGPAIVGREVRKTTRIIPDRPKRARIGCLFTDRCGMVFVTDIIYASGAGDEISFAGGTYVGRDIAQKIFGAHCSFQREAPSCVWCGKPFEL